MKNGELPTIKHHGESVTIGFSPTPTLYKIRWLAGGEEYVRCGADILLNGLQGNLAGEARCPVCQNRTQLVVANGKIDRLQPSDAMLHVVEMPANSGRIWIECESTNIFDKEACLRQWISGYKGKKGLATTIQDYHNKLVARRSNRGQSPQYSPLQR